MNDGTTSSGPNATRVTESHQLKQSAQRSRGARRHSVNLHNLHSVVTPSPCLSDVTTVLSLRQHHCCSVPPSFVNRSVRKGDLSKSRPLDLRAANSATGNCGPPHNTTDAVLDSDESSDSKRNEPASFPLCRAVPPVVFPWRDELHLAIGDVRPRLSTRRLAMRQ